MIVFDRKDPQTLFQDFFCPKAKMAFFAFMFLGKNNLEIMCGDLFGLKERFFGYKNCFFR